MHFCEKTKIENVKCMMLQYFALLYLVEYFTFEQKLILFVLKLQTSQEQDQKSIDAIKAIVYCQARVQTMSMSRSCPGHV